MIDDKAIEEMRGYIDENRTRYEEAKMKLADPTYVHKTFEAIKSMLGDIMGYNPIKHDTSGIVAAFVLGRTQIRFGGLYDDLQFMSQFEEEEARFYEAINENTPEGQ